MDCLLELGCGRRNGKGESAGCDLIMDQNETQIDKAKQRMSPDIDRKTEFDLQKPRKMISNSLLQKSRLFLVTIVLFK